MTLFLYESWTHKDSNIDLAGYAAHNLYRKFQHKNARRHSGGIVLYYKEHLKPGITIIRTHHDTIIWLKLDNTFLILIMMFMYVVYIYGAKNRQHILFQQLIYLILFKMIFATLRT